MTGCVSKTDISDYLPNSNRITNSQLTMEAILSRDQRTTSHRVITERSKLQNLTPAPPSSLGVRIENVSRSAKVAHNLNVELKNGKNSAQRYSQMKNSSSRRIRGYAGYRGFAVTWLRLGSLLVTLLVASIHAAPTMTSQIRTEAQGKWVNPCGLQGAAAVELNDTDVTQLTDSELLSQIILQAKNALMDAEIFRDEFIKKSFGLNFTKLHEDWGSQHYDWLPSTEQIPKNLGEKLDEEFLEKLDLDTALLDAYEYMQTYAVALEQVVWDQKALGRELSENFKNTEFKLRTVLCEIQVALVERQVNQREDVRRDVMPDDFRKQSKDDTARNLRDWLIFRDYMNGLEYVEQVFDHLRSRIKS